MSFLSRRHVSIISSSSRLGREVFWSLHGQVRSTDDYFFMCTEMCYRCYGGVEQRRFNGVKVAFGVVAAVDGVWQPLVPLWGFGVTKL